MVLSWWRKNFKKNIPWSEKKAVVALKKRVMYWFTWKNNWFFLRGSPLFSFPFFPHFYEILHDEQLKVSYICATKKYTSAYELQFVRNADRNENKNMNDIYSKRWLRTTKEICKCLEALICQLSRILEVHMCHRKRPWSNFFWTCLQVHSGSVSNLNYLEILWFWKINLQFKCRFQKHQSR